jgi:hypothetical protein
MTSYNEHLQWAQRAEGIPEQWIGSAVQYDDQPSEELRAEWHDRGWGPDGARPYPQQLATDEQAASMQQGWDRLIDKAKRDIERIIEETRLAAYVASHQPGGPELAAIISLMRKRYHEQSTDDDDSGHRDDGDSGQSRTRPG